MKIGVYMFPTEYSMGLVDLAVALEERGFESLFVPEHTHIPASRQTPWPGGGDLPKEYSHTLDPFVGLAAVAAATKKLRIGTGICLLTERDPIVTAKEVATLDLLSNGRFEFGIGAGWNVEEMENHGTVFDTRFRVMVDRAKAMQAIWTQDVATYSGEFTQFESIWSWPKPAQKPHPPILVGGAFPHSARRAIAYGDGWMPVSERIDLIDVLPKFRQMAAEADRNPDDIPVTAFGTTATPGDIKRMSDAGVDRVVFGLPAAKADEVLPIMDECAEVMRQND